LSLFDEITINHFVTHHRNGESPYANMLANFNNTNGNTTKNPTVVIGIDHGYGNIKTANTCFRAGVTVYDKEPFFIIGSLQYNIQKQSVVLLRLRSCAASTLQNRDIHGFSLDLRGSRSCGMKRLPSSG